MRTYAACILPAAFTCSLYCLYLLSSYLRNLSQANMKVALVTTLYYLSHLTAAAPNPNPAPAAVAIANPLPDPVAQVEPERFCLGALILCTFADGYQCYGKCQPCRCPSTRRNGSPNTRSGCIDPIGAEAYPRVRSL